MEKSEEMEISYVWLRRKWEDGNCSLYKFTLTSLLHKTKFVYKIKKKKITI